MFFLHSKNMMGGGKKDCLVRGGIPFLSRRFACYAWNGHYTILPRSPSPSLPPPFLLKCVKRPEAQKREAESFSPLLARNPGLLPLPLLYVDVPTTRDGGRGREFSLPTCGMFFLIRSGGGKEEKGGEEAIQSCRSSSCPEEEEEEDREVRPKTSLVNPLSWPASKTTIL